MGDAAWLADVIAVAADIIGMKMRECLYTSAAYLRFGVNSIFAATLRAAPGAYISRWRHAISMPPEEESC